MELLITILGGLIVFSIIVLIHEFGHFIAAKKSGVKVEEFAVGLPPRIWSKKRGETTYVVNALPLGGYVKLLGEDGASDDDPKSMASKPAIIKIIILLAGVALNFLLAYLLIVSIYIAGVTQPIIPGLADQPGVKSTMKARVDSVEKDTPAEKEGLLQGDIIKEAEGQKVTDSVNLIAIIQEKVNKDPSAKINVVIDRNGQTLSKSFSTYKFKEKAGNKEVEINRIGVVLKTDGKISATPLVALRAGLTEIAYFIPYYLGALAGVLGQTIANLHPPAGVTGPVGIFQISGSAIQSGLSIFVQWIALISVAIGILNIMPVLPLDGGHVFVVAIESAVRKKISQRVKVALSAVGWVALGSFLILVTLSDLKII